MSLHILTQDVHLTKEIPHIPTGLKAVEEFLPYVVGLIPSLDRPGRWALLLEPSLPAHWQLLQWEALTLMGRSVSSQAVVVRCAKWTHERPSVRRSASFLNLFPPEAFSFTRHLRPSILSRNLQKSAFLELDMQTRGDVLIMAHGEARGLVDASGNIFVPPFTHPMPVRIWLLACNVTGAMDRLAKQLLDQGCKTVVSATGDLSAPEMARLVNRVFADDNALDPAPRSLPNLEGVLTGIDAPLGLTLWGEFNIDQSPSAKWNYMTWSSEHGVFKSNNLDDQTGRDEFFEAYSQISSQNTWTLTRKWTVPPLLWLAETYHHPVMPLLAGQIDDLTSSAAIRGLAAAARRVGNYCQVAKYLSLSLNLPDLTALERSEHLGSLVNLFIDMNLPDSAISTIRLHEECNLDDPRDQFEADFRRLDWSARAEARRGRLAIALDCMTAKRKRAKVDTGRELAWQLYFSTWGRLSGQITKLTCDSFAKEVMARLSYINPPDIGFGNETSAYLLRSLAVHAWLVKDDQQIEVVRGWLGKAEDRLTDDDPGPWAYTIAYMHYLDAIPSPGLERAIAALERARYFLEAASLSGFAKQETQSRKFLERFQKRRVEIVKQLNKWNDNSSVKISDEISSREILESRTIGSFLESSLCGTLPL